MVVYKPSDRSKVVLSAISEAFVSFLYNGLKGGKAFWASGSL